MDKIALTIPGIKSPIDSAAGLPTGVPTGGLFNGNQAGTGIKIIQAFLDLALVLIILTSLYFILQGGIDIIQSEGKKEKLQRGREKVIYAVFGLILVFAAFLTVSVGSVVFHYDLLCIVFDPTHCK